MKNFVWNFLTWFLVSAISYQVQGQIPGSLDTSFRIRPNYGVVFSPHQVFPLKDGRTLCFTDLGNFFNGKRTGSFFRLLPNGDLDESFQSPTIHVGCFPSFCACLSSRKIIPCQDGGALVFNNGGYTIDDKPTQLSCLRIKSDGQIDTSIQHLSGTPLGGFGFYYFKPGGEGFLAWNYLSNQLHWVSDDLSQDSVILVGGGTSIWVRMVPGSYGNMNLILWDSSNVAKYFPYHFETRTLGEPVPKFPGSGVPKFFDSFGRIYEVFYSPNGSNSTPYTLLRRSFATGILDSQFVVQCGSQYHSPDSITIAGDGTVRKLLGQGKYLRFHPTTGDPVDTIKNELDHQFLGEDGWLKLGFNSGNRWEWRKTDSLHQTQVSRFTQFGANGPIRQAKALPNGKYLIGGSFTNYDGWPTAGIARLHPNGWIDSSFSNHLLQQNLGEREIPLFQFLPDLNRILLISGFPSGGSFIHLLLPDGSPDPAFSAQSFSGYSGVIHQVFGAERLPSGNLLVLALTDQNPKKLQVFKLAPNGSVLTIFPNIQPAQIFPGILEGYFVNNQAFGKMRKLNGQKYYLEMSYTFPVQPDPLCRPSKFFNTNTRTVAAVFDTMGTLLPNMPFVPYESWNFGVEKTWNESVAPYLYLYKNFNYQLIRLSENLEEDTSFHLRMANHEPLPYYNRKHAILECQSSDVLVHENVFFEPFGFENFTDIFNPEIDHTFKANYYGQIDSLFEENQLRGKILNAIEPDTSHILLFGNFQTFGKVHTPYIARIHNKTSLIARQKQLAKSEMAILYPNPARDRIYVKNWIPGMEIQMVNQLGQIVITKLLETKFFPVPERVSNGLYFWTIKQNNRQISHGKLLIVK